MITKVDKNTTTMEQEIVQQILDPGDRPKVREFPSWTYVLHRL